MLSLERKYTSEEHFDIVTVQRILEILHFITPLHTSEFRLYKRLQKLTKIYTHYSSFNSNLTVPVHL